MAVSGLKVADKLRCEGRSRKCGNNGVNFTAVRLKGVRISASISCPWEAKKRCERPPLSDSCFARPG